MLKSYVLYEVESDTTHELVIDDTYSEETYEFFKRRGIPFRRYHITCDGERYFFFKTSNENALLRGLKQRGFIFICEL